MGAEGLKKTDDNVRLKWLDGLKGLACILVFMHHFMLAFFSASYFGAERESFLNGVDSFLASSPLGVFINGNFQVCIFLLIAAFLPAKRIMECRREALKDKASAILLKRYPRLLIPVFTVCAVNFIVLKILTATGTNYSDAPLVYDKWEYLIHSIFLVFLTPETGLVGPMWSIFYIFFGSIFAVMLAIPDGKERRYMPFAYIFILFALCRVNTQFAPCVLGVLAADIICCGRIKLPQKKTSLIAASSALILAGLFLGGYPSYVLPENIYAPLYRVFMFICRDNSFNSAVMIHSVGAFLLFSGVAVWQETGLGSLLSSKFFSFLGSISLGVYLLHMMWIDYLGYYLMDRFNMSLGSRMSAACVVLPVLLAAVILSAVIFRKIVEEPSEKLLSNIR